MRLPRLSAFVVITWLLSVAAPHAVALDLGETPVAESLPLSGLSVLASGETLDSPTAGVPALSSKLGAPYMLYLDFAGFDFTGTWGSSGNTPGVNTSFNGTTGTFSTSDQTLIKNMWARVANSYAPFNVNVTTIDPAVAAGKADTDAHRQAYYDSQARMMHTVVTTSYSWYGAAGGVSYVGTAPSSYNPVGANGGAGAGWHTNWVFTQGVGTGLAAGQAIAHENGHGLGLEHQSDYDASKQNEYSVGDNSSASGTYAPIMGAAYYTQRGAWRLGSVASTSATQNDPKIIATDPNMGGYRADGIGHSLAAATPIPLVGAAVDAALAGGIIEPLSTSTPTPLGINNYTTDYWKVASDGIHSISLTVWDGNDLLVTGTADPGATLRSKLNILDPGGNLVVSGAAVEAASTLSETYTGLLPAGYYYAQVTSYGGHTQTLADGLGGFFDTTYYYDMGAYFMTGSGFAAIPEPGTLALLTAGLAIVLCRRRR